MTVRRLLALCIGFVGVVPAGIGSISWPTPNPAFAEGETYERFVQPTVSGAVVSGLFGCVRSGGSQFHEGLDLFPIKRDSRGEALDSVHAILPGVVRYVNQRPGNSSYGRYLVIEHTAESPAFVSLYAHLASVEPGLRAGSEVTNGQRIGIMGRSAGGYTIPRERAHLHLEFGVRLTGQFSAWYASQRYTSKNQHGLYNGYNILGLDFLDFVERTRSGEVADLAGYVQRLSTAATVIVRTGFVPDFVERYPELVRNYEPGQKVSGWTIDFTWFGLPKSWSPIVEGEPPPDGMRSYEIAFHDTDLLARFPCHNLVRVNGGSVVPDSRLQQVLGLLFASK